MGEVQAGLDIGSAGKQAGQMASDISSKFEEPAKKPTKDVSPSALKQDLLKKGGTGTAPDTKIRSQLAGPLGADIGGAKIHTGPAAASAAQGLQASAFTIGQDMFFGPGQYDPATPQGMALIAHEATHVLQQSGAKGDKTRFNTPRGGDEMEQEAQDVAQLVLSDLGKGESLHVKQYVRNYTSEGGDPVNPTDRNRLDAISLKALKYAQREIRLRRIGRTFPCDELVVDISLDLSEGSDTLLIKEWGEAIVDAVVALRVPGSAPEVAVQRAPAPDPAAKANDKETIDLSIMSLSPTIGDSSFVMSQDPAAMVSQILGMSTFTAGGKGSIRVFSAIIQDYLDVKDFDKSKPFLRTSHLQISFKKQAEGNADAFNKLAPPFRNAAQTVKGQVDAFLKEYMEQGKTAFLKLTEVARKQVHNKLVEYGFSSDPSLIKDPGSYKFMGGNDTGRKIAEKAKELMPLRKKVDENKESAENLNSWWHRNTSRESTLKADEIKAKALPQAEADWHRALGEASATYPILSHYQTYDKLEELASNKNPNEVILKQLVEILVNLDTLDDKAKNDPGKIVYDLPSARAEAKKFFPEPWKAAYVDMVAEDRGDADTGWKTLLGAIAAALSLATGGAAGVGLLALRAAGAAISVAGLYTGIQDYRLADAAHMSDMDIAKSLSADEPSMFWLVFEIVTTVIGLKADLAAMRTTIGEIRAAYKVAQTGGETAALEKVLNARKVPAETIKLILSHAAQGGIALTNFIRNPDPTTALGLLTTFSSFGDLRTAMFQSKETPVTISAAKKVLQAQRVKEANMAVQKVTAKYPKVKITVIDSGFDRPLTLAVISSEGIPPPPKGPPAAGGGPGKGGTLIGSPAPDPNAGPSGTLKASPPPPPNQKGGTLKGSPAPDPNVGPSGTIKGPHKVPDGVYAVKDAKNVVDPASLAKTLKSRTGSADPPGGDPSLGKTVKADPPPPSKPGDPDPALAKTTPGGPPDPALGKTAPAGQPDPAAFGKTDPAVSPSQLRDALGELRLADNGQGPLGTVRDWNILDPNAAQHSYGGVEFDPVKNEWVSTKTRAPIGKPEDLEGISDETYNWANVSKTIAKNKGLPEYEGQWIGLPSGRFVVEPNTLGGTSVKFILKDTVTGELYIFKPAVGEMPLGSFGHKADGRTLFVRGAFAARLASDLPAMGEALPFVTVVVHDGKVGSLQPFKKGTVDLDTLSRSRNPSDQALYNRVMNDDPGFTKFRANLRAFDHVINNSDRDTNPGNIMIHEDPVTKKITYYAIDQDASLAPGAKTIIHPGLANLTQLPRANLNDPWTDPSKPCMGKISKTLYDQMVAIIANESSVRLEWKRSFALNDSALDGVMGRMREVVADFADRRTKAKDTEIFFD